VSDLSNQETELGRGEHPLLAIGAGILSAVAYTAANVCLRSVPEVDVFWVSCLKAVPTVVLVAPFLVTRGVSGQSILGSPRMFGMLVAAAVFGQLAGNVAFQFALSSIGLALSVALVFGTMISSGVAIGHWALGERLTGRTIFCSALLIAAILVLSLGARDASRSLLGKVDLLMAIGGILAACSAGTAYSVLGGVIRRVSRSGMPQETILMVVGLVGMLLLGTISSVRIGGDGMLGTQWSQLGYMLGAGVWNAIAFFALTYALRRTTLAIVNALNASQVAMAALAGVALFAEPPTATMGAGVALTILGLIFLRRPAAVSRTQVTPQSPEPDTPQAVSAIE